ncbi:MAG: aspartate-semialdehyde dehydrogenase, partial [Clostridiaceae bacterium]|nr:aspartate-semialdehyde dehydrogenase [Clostridiaceae bacterium]
MKEKLKVGVLGGTGFVGQRLVTLLHDHPYFDIKVIAASERSAGKSYSDAVNGKWKLSQPIPDSVKSMTVKNLHDIDEISSEVDFVFCAVDMPAN